MVSYLKDFLFPPDRIDAKVRILSGGERNRLLLARIFTRAANLLVLDEPTNDLDVETLELLEELLADYDGTLILVSHDRTFLDNVVTSTLVFEHDGQVNQYVGGYTDWLRQRQDLSPPKEPSNSIVKPGSVKASQKADTSKQGKLSYKEQRELDSLPDTIEAIEKQIEQLEHAISRSDFYQQDSDSISRTLAELEELRNTLQSSYERWELLDNI